MRALVISAIVFAGGCRDAAKPTASCRTQTAELATFLRAVLDPAQPVAAPWPTGDAAFDADLVALRQHARDQAKPIDPAARQPPMTPGITPGRLEQELAACPAAAAQLKKSGEASPDQRIATFVGLADAIASCDCTPSIPRVKALVYLFRRGPD